MSKSLVAFDTDKIKGYVFATHTLKEIRGASALLDRLNRVVMPRLVGGKCVYANGGAGLFVVDTSRVETVIQAVRRVYREETLTASVTGAAIELPANGTQHVQTQLELLRHRLRVEKDRHNVPIPLFTHPLLHFCDSCGTQYATAQVDGDMLCPSCQRKRAEDNKIKREIRLWVSGKQTPDSNRLWGRVIEMSSRGYQTSRYNRPESFEDLGELSSPKGYMALIYADGDGMGREVEEIDDLDQMQRFAKAVDDSLYQAVVEAIDKHLKPTQGKSWPFDILLLGGDDLVMVTRAQSGIKTALHVIERFPVLTGQAWKKKLRLSASVVLAHVNYPISRLISLAESSLKFAKREAARRYLQGQRPQEGMLNFLVVSSANHLDFEEYYTQVLKSQEPGGDTLYRTSRPYTASGMRDLLEKVRIAQDIPRTKLEQLRAAVFKSRQQGTIDAMKVALRSRDETAEKILRLVGSAPETQLHLPWIRSEGRQWYTPILDIVDLLDFVE